MRTFNLGLLFHCSPYHLPIAHVYVKCYSHPDFPAVSKDLILITPEAVTVGELEHYIDQLQDELERIRKEGRNKYAKEQEQFTKRARRQQAAPESGSLT